MASFFSRPLSSFTFLNMTQFLGAFNDNVFKLLIIYCFIQIEGIENSNTILAVTGAIFVLPFILFSASSGFLADRFSKSNIIIYTRILEFVTLSLGVLALQYESKIGAYSVLFLMASLSALFAPSKYGIIPELVETDKIPRANGLMTSFTFLAMILGSGLAPFLLHVTDKHFVFVALFSALLAFIAMVTSFCIQYTPPVDTTKRYNILLFSDIYKTLKIASEKPSLLTAVFGSAFFLFLAGFLQLNMIPFAVKVLHLTDLQGGYLFLLSALGIGSGSIFAGRISGKVTELGLVPLAAVGVAVGCYLLDFYSGQLWVVVPLVVVLGFCGGVYQVPLDSYIQVASPNQYRGQIVAATNFLSFFGVLCSSALLYLLSEVLGLSPDKGFVVMGSLTVIVTGLIGFQYFDYLSRFICMALSKLHFQTSFYGVDKVPKDVPVIYVCKHTAWNDTLLMLGSQRRRMRFFIEHVQQHEHRIIQMLYRLLRIIPVPPIEPLEDNPRSLSALKFALKNGISVCIFVDNDDLNGEIEKLKQSSAFQEAFIDSVSPLIPVVIEKGEKSATATWLQRLFRKFRIPAAISFG